MDKPNPYIFPGPDLGKDDRYVETYEKVYGWRQPLTAKVLGSLPFTSNQTSKGQVQEEQSTLYNPALRAGFLTQTPTTKVQLGPLLSVQSKDHTAF